MKISKEDLVRINHGFGGNLRSDSSLDYAIEMQNNNKLGDYKKLAYLLRAILVDHPFSDGNKRTAMFLCLNFAEDSRKQIDRDLLLEQIISIAKNFGKINSNLQVGEIASQSDIFPSSPNPRPKSEGFGDNINEIRNIEWRIKNAIR